MGFMAAAIPIAGMVLGALSKKNDQQQSQVPRQPTMGEVFAMNDRNYQSPQFSSPAPVQPTLTPIGGGQNIRGFNG